MRIIFRV
jgi:hypothetical protein